VSNLGSVMVRDPWYKPLIRTAAEPVRMQAKQAFSNE